MHRRVSADLKSGQYWDAIDSARSWLECTSYGQLARELARIDDDERASLIALLRDVLLMGGPLGGPLWGTPLLFRYDSPTRDEVVFMPPKRLPAGSVLAGWLPVYLLDSEEPLGFACKPASIAVATGALSAAVLVLQSADTEPPELADDWLATSVSPADDERVMLSAGPLLPWIEALEAAQLMLDEIAIAALPENSPRRESAGQISPLFLSPKAQALASARVLHLAEFAAPAKRPKTGKKGRQEN
ncbi:hypothetical protein [Rhodocyclus tenuis]|uniref:Uncharacterized protein n=1 Tax=Rhodocyclus tenuis TaxID=1066 RepID=A0A840GGG1_RHOTE|nr:hypothetical protein [Rhodocyclus tenuis]MBB4247592.1 hypothetical protein [Rhodocyclus tenuis]